LLVERRGKVALFLRVGEKESVGHFLLLK